MKNRILFLTIVVGLFFSLINMSYAYTWPITNSRSEWTTDEITDDYGPRIVKKNGNLTGEVHHGLDIRTKNFKTNELHKPVHAIKGGTIKGN
jgi:hypothetical protein